MNSVKRMLGLVWILLGPAAILYLVTTASSEIARKPLIETKIQWGVFILVFIPILAGLVLFGYYALKGEFDHAEPSD